MRKGIYFVLMALIIVLLGVLSINLYQKNVEAKSAILKKELLIFQNHISGTVRAVDSKNNVLMKDTLLRLNTFETFHSKYIDTKPQLVLSSYEQGLRYLLTTKTSNYNEIKNNLDIIFQTVTSYDDEILDQEQFEKIIDELLPQVEEFRDKAKTLSEEG
ncbi:MULTISPECIES: hypothetical protein [Pontibacillus]|uniref:Uncharacterized protein n=1 Tax=Pontibacillus marinus BH030004 = DSM 16465 TaxID=1385511 RepID=A0A0A5HI82_9BACI|nr:MULTISPECIES: hypothetical protein [Pontibacillus]KGX83357.1 hypothetical protein N783_04325 [Pontibacillus marinus BH030004 = DSM 16465]QHE50875.1 hypothetical protein GS400_01935 [Pontibacillus sp. HMF3514]QHE52764.1 hypothetical protein GS400_12320 [Pontibacillus sp. HMF3514]